jgi:hypothetical protein
MTIVDATDAEAIRAPAHRVLEALFVIVASSLIFMLTARRDVDVYDEGLILTGAMRVVAGAVPHRDFYNVYGPGQFYVLGALFDLFGQDVWVERVYDFGLKAGIVCFFYLISTRLMAYIYACSATVLCVLWIATAGTPGYAIWPSLFLTFAAVWLTIPIFYAGENRPARLVAGGLCAGTVVLFRYDMGVLTLAVLSAVLIAFGWLERRLAAPPIEGIARIIAPFWIGPALLLILLVIAYVKFGIMNDFVFQIVSFPSIHYVETRSLPFPKLHSFLTKGFIVYMPPFVILSFVFLMISKYSNRKSIKIDVAEACLSSMIVVLAAGLYFKGVARVSVPHMISSIVPSLIVLGFLVDQLRSRQTSLARSALAPVVLALIVTLVPSVFAAHNAINLARNGIAKDAVAGDLCNPQNSLSRAPCFSMSPARYRTARYVIDNTTPDQQILVANGNNDRSPENDNSLYFLAGRLPATKWAQFDPGLQSSEATQAQMIRELENKKPPFVILGTEFDNWHEPNASSRHSGATLLDDYIHQHYKETVRFDPYIILKR